MTSSNIVLTTDHLRRVVAHFMRQPAFSFDVESVGEYRGVPALNQVTWLSMATYGMCVAIPMGHPIGTKQVGTAKEPRTDKNGKVKYFTVPVYEDPPDQLTPAEVFDVVRPLFFNPAVTKVAHEATFDLGSTAKYWEEICCGPYDDTKVIMRLLDENTASKDNGLKAWTTRQFGVKYDNENVGRKVEIHPFGKVAHYSYMDALYTWLLWLRNQPRISKEKLTVIHDEIERPLIRPLTAMRLAGINMDNDRLHATQDELAARLVVEEGEVYRQAGQRFNLNSAPQKVKVLFDPVTDGGQGLKPWKFSQKTGEPSADADVLASYPTNPVCQALLAYAATHTLLSTYLNAWLGVAGDSKKEGKIVDGILYTEFQQHGTVTGRFCVSGDTLLTTSRGTFRFDEYLPVQGDTVLTHLGNRKPVLRKIYKGRFKMYRVSLYNGSTIKCTAAHRVNTSAGWKSVGELQPGDKVLSYVSFPDLYARWGEGCASISSILREPQEAYYSPGRRDDGHHFSECSRGAETATVSGHAEEGAESSVLAVQDGLPEPYEGQVWEAASQLPGRNLGWARVPTDQSRGHLHLAAPVCDGTSSGSGEATSLAGCASYRRGPLQQRPGQPGAGNNFRPWEAALQEVKVGEITPLGTMGVWDIEVADDHSYLAGGFVNHNSGRSPNLQNIPRPDKPDGLLIRGSFIAPPGHKLVVADYGQIELVVLAHLIGRGKLFDGFMAGVDPHTTHAAGVLRKSIDQVTKDERQRWGKTLGFTIVNGAGWKTIAEVGGFSEKQAKQVQKDYGKEFPEVDEFRHAMIRWAKERTGTPYVRSLLGRKRRLPGLHAADNGLRMYSERQLFNFLIQGGAADLMKLALIRADAMIREQVPEAWLSLTIHDELVAVAPDELADECQLVLIEAMTGPAMQSLISVPLTVESAIANRWSEAK